MKKQASERVNRIYLQWHITNRCGNRCRHCYQSSFSGTDFVTGDAPAVLDDLMECCEVFNALPIIALSGGDPLRCDGLWSIMDEIVSRIGDQKRISILGNPEMLDERTISRLKGYPLHHYQLSIDGMRETHDHLRYQGSFQRTMRAIHDLSRAGIVVNIMSTVSRANLGEMREVMQAVYGQGASRWSFARWVPTSGDCGITADQYMMFLWEITTEHRRYEGPSRKRPDKEPLLAICTPMETESEDLAVSGGCGIGYSMLSLLPDKTVMACRRHPGSVLGRWTKSGDFLSFLVDNPKMEAYRRVHEIEVCGKCEKLKFCRGCRAAAFVANGKENTCDPQCPLANERR